jgi:hypothetical protein
MLQPYNKTASRQGPFIAEQVIAPVRDAACGNMDWKEIVDCPDGSYELLWKARPRRFFKREVDMRAWNNRYAGKRVGYPLNGGYILFKFDGKYYYAHRVIYEILRGPIPSGMVVDHIDLNPANNHIDNLRIATLCDNMANKSKYRSNTTGHKGVAWDKTQKRYVAHLKRNGVRVLKKNFERIEDAIEARAEAARIHHGKFARH